MTFTLDSATLNWILGGLTLAFGGGHVPALLRWLRSWLPTTPAGPQPVPAQPATPSQPAQPAAPAKPNDHPLLREVASQILRMLGVPLPLVRLGASLQVQAAAVVEQEDRAMLALGRLLTREMEAMDAADRAAEVWRAPTSAVPAPVPVPVQAAAASPAAGA